MTKYGQATDWIATHFEYKELTPIHGRPSYETLKRMFNEVKANATSVPSTLGGGQHGHLGLVLPDIEYALISATAFVRPAQPANLNIPATATQHIVRTMTQVHDRETQVFNTVLGVEKALRQQIVAALEPAYLLSIKDRVTNSLNHPVSFIFRNHLFTRYGKVKPQALSEVEIRVRTMQYDITQPPDVIYIAIEDLMDMATAARAPFTQVQAINFAYNILNATGRFKDSIIEWGRRPIVEHTWVNFKLHFTNAHEEIEETEGLTLADSSFDANMVSQLVCAAVQEALDSRAPPDSFVEEKKDDDDIQQQANNTNQQTSSSNDMQTLLAQMQQMQMQNQTLMMQLMNGGRNSNGNRLGNNPRNVKKQAPGERKYCWTHGWCAHTGNECNKKADGHKDKATLTNKMGGSNWNCPS